MQLENTFVVPLPVDRAWDVLIDIERIVPCMPGASLDSVDEEGFSGRVKVKLGPISLTYRGSGVFIERDPLGGKAVIDARAKDQTGAGTAGATVTALLTADGDATRVDVRTDLHVTGRAAQFGRGLMAEVADRLMGEFARRLEEMLLEGETPRPPVTPDRATSGVFRVPGALRPVNPQVESAPLSATTLLGGTEPSTSGEFDVLRFTMRSVVSRIRPLGAIGVVNTVLLFWVLRRQRQPAVGRAARTAPHISI